MQTFSEKLLDEVCRNTKKLSDCWDTMVIYVICTTILQSFYLFLGLFVKLSSKEHSIWNKNNYLQWMSEECLSQERLSNSWLSVWQAGLFQYSVHESRKSLRNFSIFRPCINLCPRGDLQRHKYNNLDKRNVLISVCNCLNLAEEPFFICNSDPHQLVASFVGALENSGFQSKAKMKTWPLISRQQ